jgi:hypothetical protein
VGRILIWFFIDIAFVFALILFYLHAE